MATPTGNACGSIGGIDFEEATGTGKLTTSRGSARGTRIFFVDWDDRIEFARQLTGFFTIVGNSINQQFPVTFPGYQFLEAAGITTEGLGKISFETNGDFRYEFAKVEVTYEPRPEKDRKTAGEEKARTLSTETTRTNIEFLEFKSLSLSWVNDPKVAIGDPIKKGKRIVTITHTITEEEAPESKKALTASLAATVNSEIFLEVAIGKLLYLGAEESRVIMSDGSQPFKIVHNFLERPEAIWNNFFRDDAKPPAFEQVQTTETDKNPGAGNPPIAVFNTFPSADHNKLIDRDFEEEE